MRGTQVARIMAPVVRGEEPTDPTGFRITDGPPVAAGCKIGAVPLEAKIQAALSGSVAVEAAIMMPAAAVAGTVAVAPTVPAVAVAPVISVV